MGSIFVLIRHDLKGNLILDVMLCHWVSGSQCSFEISIATYLAKQRFNPEAWRTSKLAVFKEISCAFDPIDRAVAVHWNSYANTLE
jgi:hypothetical protein